MRRHGPLELVFWVLVIVLLFWVLVELTGRS
jgi:hypothetical protein